MILAHDVYFTLHDASDEATAKLVKAGLEYLSGYPGCVAMSAGARAPEFERAVNDQAFDVALHVAFVDRAAHDAYQAHPVHDSFREECGTFWTTVRIFDSVALEGAA